MTTLIIIFIVIVLFALLQHNDNQNEINNNLEDIKSGKKSLRERLDDIHEEWGSDKKDK